MKKIIFILFFIITAFFGKAQDSVFVRQYKSNLMYVVKTSQGNTYVGFVTNETRDYITIENRKQQQTYEINKNAIVYSRLFSDRKALEQVMDVNYHASYYMFSPSSVIFDKADATLNYQWFVFDNTSFKMNDNWDISVNSILFYPSSLGVKCAFEIGGDMYIGGNIFAVANISDKVMPYFFLGYGGIARFTKGNTNNNFSLSAGVIGLNSQLFQSTAIRKEPFLNLPFGGFAYVNRFSEQWAFCAEGFYFPEAQTGFGGAGIKYMQDRETCWTFGCFAFASVTNNRLSFGNRVLPIPFVSYSTNIFRD
jgi:hypothetical protein